ncbi:MAG: YceK/YidQ family lipoprotein [Planctomycetes bacterium]|nr:YceK/YidQ family lipoprotein [Planctomycetota bacterium]
MNQIHAQAEGPAAYGGVRHVLARWDHPDTTPGDQAAMVMDFPFSFVFDTLFLPLFAINEIVENGIVVTDARPSIERGTIADRSGR